MASMASDGHLKWAGLGLNQRPTDYELRRNRLLSRIVPDEMPSVRGVRLSSVESGTNFGTKFQARLAQARAAAEGWRVAVSWGTQPSACQTQVDALRRRRNTHRSPQDDF